jgi:hypothetical protein
MPDDENVLDREQHFVNERMEREGGVFVEPEHTNVDCNQEEPACAPDEYPEDPVAIGNRPGTVDDLTYSQGVQPPNAADQQIFPEGRTRLGKEKAPDTERELPLGQADEDELWRAQEPLIEEDEVSGVKLPEGMDEENGERILDVMGDGSAVDISEDVAGSSATAEPDLPEEHGGFPDRKE